jgi:hypothetical protein
MAVISQAVGHQPRLMIVDLNGKSAPARYLRIGPVQSTYSGATDLWSPSLPEGQGDADMQTSSDRYAQIFGLAMGTVFVVMLALSATSYGR